MFIELNEPPFVSISGEAGFFPQGSFCTFIRFQGCNLRCTYPCDTVRSQREGAGQTYSIDELSQSCTTQQVLITGGEPLLQRQGLLRLAQELLVGGYSVQVETNGTQEIPHIPAMKGHGGWVVDRKGPSAGVRAPSIREMGGDAFYQWDTNPIVFKYVLAPVHSRFFQADYDFIHRDMQAMDTAGYRGRFLISPMDADVEGFGNLFCFPREFQDRVIISLQIHKLLGVA